MLSLYLSPSFVLASEGDFSCRLEIRRGTSYGDPVIRQPDSETESAEMALNQDGDYITIVSRSDEHYAGIVVFGKPDKETNYQPTIALSIGPNARRTNAYAISYQPRGLNYYSVGFVDYHRKRYVSLRCKTF